MQVLAVALHIPPLQTLHVAVAQSCHARKEEHLLDVVVFFGQPVFDKFFQFCFCQKALLLLFALGAFHPLQDAVVNEAVLVGIVEDTGQSLEIQTNCARLHISRL